MTVDDRPGPPASGPLGMADSAWLPGDGNTMAACLAALPIAVMATEGHDHCVVAANPAFGALTGRTDVVGHCIREVIPEAVGRQLIAALDRVRSAGRSEQLDGYRLQLGEPETLREVFVDCLVVPWSWPDGRPRGLVTSAVDVTARVLAQRNEQQRTARAERRYAAAHDVALELQRALLPADLPVLPGVGLSARYLVSGQDQAAGGDWFDAVRLPGDRVALVVGDVVGHGVAAAAAMGQLRVMLRQLLLSHDGDIVRALTDLDDHAADDPAMQATTICLAVLDSTDGTLTYCTSGHPAPLIVDPTGGSRFLPGTGAGPLGSGREPAVRTDSLGPGEVILLYSDGLIERAGQPLRRTQLLLAAVAEDAAADRITPLTGPTAMTERICAQTVEVLTRSGGHDDVTVLAAQRREPPPPLDLEVPAAVGELGILRSELRSWLTVLPATTGQVQALELAVTEVATNAIEHAYRDGDGPRHRVSLTGHLTSAGVVELAISDGGTWQPAPAAGTGRGLWIAGSLADDLQINRPEAGGSVVTVRSRLRRPAYLSTAVTGPVSARNGAGGEALVLEVADGPPRVLRATGVIDAATGAAFADCLDAAGRGGIHALTVDLTAVTILSSVGVRALFAARDRHRRRGTSLDLLAAADSAAADVLDLVGLGPAAGPLTVVNGT